MRRRSRSCASTLSAAVGASTLIAWSQRLCIRTRAPNAAARLPTVASEACGRTNNQTVSEVSCARCQTRGSTGETEGRCAAKPAGRSKSQTSCRVKTGKGKGDEGRGGVPLHGFHLAETYSNDSRDARFLHSHAIHGVRRLHRSGVVRDNDELRLVLELRQQAHIAPDVGVVEGRVYLVQQAERARLCEEDREQQRHRDERALSRRQQMDPLRPLAARRRMNLDFTFQRLVLVGQAYVALATAEQGLEDRAEMLPNFPEGLEEHRLGGLIDFTRRLL